MISLLVPLFLAPFVLLVSLLFAIPFLVHPLTSVASFSLRFVSLSQSIWVDMDFSFIENKEGITSMVSFWPPGPTFSGR